MDITFLVAVSIFLIFISIVLVSAINYFTFVPESQKILEIRDKVKSLFDIFFGSGGVVTNERLTTSLYRVPILLQEQNGTARTNEVVAVTANFDNDCTQLVSWNNTIRVYDQQFNELPSKISYQQFCSSQLLNNSLVTFVVNMSANEKKKVYVYSINNTNTTASNWNMTIKGYWKFDDAGGTTATDSSGLQNNGTLNNFNFNSLSGWFNGTSCKYGSCLMFDGSNEYVNVGNLSSYQIQSNITLSFWINTRTLSSDAGIAGTGIGTGYQCTHHTNGNVICYIQTSGNSVSASVSSGAWHHIGFTWDGTTNTNGMKLYVDGALTTQGTSSTSSMSGFGNFTIGKATTNYNGTIDDVRVYNETLSSSQISSLALTSNQPLSVQTFPPDNITAVSAAKVQQLSGRNYQDIKTVLGGDFDFRVEIK